MNSKSFGLFAFGILALVLVMGFGSAATSGVFTITDLNKPTSISESVGSFTFTFNLTYTGNSESQTISFTDSTSSIGTISIPDATGMNGTIDESRIITGTISGISGHGGETANIIINATAGTSRDDQTMFSVSITDFTESICAFDNVANANANPGYLSVDIRSIEVVEGFGADEDWVPFDEIEVEVRIDNKGINNYDIDDISVEWGLAPNNLDDDWLLEFDEIDEINLKDDDRETMIITFRLDEDDLDMNLDEFVGNDYNLVVRATGVIDDEDNKLGGIEDTCAADFEEVSVRDDDAILLTNFDIPETLQCGQTYTITADAWNIGDKDQDEVSVVVHDRDRKFMSEKRFELGDVRDFDDTQLSFDLLIPKDSEEGIYSLIFEVFDEDNDVFEVGEDDDPVKYFFPLTVSGGCSTASQITVAANVVSGGQAGKELVVRATVTNTGSSQAVYTLNVAGFEPWASSYSLDQTSLILGADEFKDVIVTLDVNKDASGTQTFYLEMVSGTGVARQPVTVTIEPSSGFLGITGNTVAGNPIVLGLGVLVLILIIAIIVVAVRRR